MSTTVRRGSSSPSLRSVVVIVLIGGTSCVTVEAGKQKPLSVQGCDATFGVLVTGFARLGTPPALHGRGSTRTMHGVRPRSHRSRIVTSTHPTVQDPRLERSVSIRCHRSGTRRSGRRILPRRPGRAGHALGVPGRTGPPGGHG